MPWGAIAGAIICAHAASTPTTYTKQALTVDLERLAREHRARVEADTRKTLRDARIGTMLLLALAVTAIYGCAQLLGF